MIKTILLRARALHTTPHHLSCESSNCDAGLGEGARRCSNAHQTAATADQVLAWHIVPIVAYVEPSRAVNGQLQGIIRTDGATNRMRAVHTTLSAAAVVTLCATNALWII